MTTIQMIPNEMLKLIPLFGGDKRHLNLFLRKCEYLILKYHGDQEQNAYIMHTITSRLIDEAAALISEREDIETWAQFKELLIQHFGEQRSEECIAIQLESLKIKQTENYLEFCNRIQSVRAVLISKVNQLPNNEVKKAKIIIYNNTSLNVFMYNLPEYLIRSVRLKAPATLEKALEFVLEEVDFHEQYTMKNKLNRQTVQATPPFKLGNATNLPSMALQPSGFKPMLQTSFTPRFNFGIPNNQPRLPQFSQRTNGLQPQFGYKFNGPPQPQFGYRPHLGQQFGTQQRFMPPSQFNVRPQQQFGYRPQFNQGQIGYRHSQPINKFGSADVSMRTAPPLKPQGQTQPQGFHLNELGLGEANYYDGYNNARVYDSQENWEHGEENYCADFMENENYVSEMEGEIVKDDTTQEEIENFYNTGLGHQPEIIRLNCNVKLKLPFVYIQEIDAKLMIDTGSTRSFLSPQKAYEFYGSYINCEPFTVISTHASSSHNEVVQIPLMPSFYSSDSHKFYLYDVDKQYDGLIGNDLLMQLEAVIDLKNLELRTKTVTLPIVNNSNCVIELGARTEQIVKLPTDQFAGEAILNFTTFCKGVRMPSAVVTCNNGYATTVIQNALDKSMNLTITKPFKVTEYKEDFVSMNCTDVEMKDVEVDTILNENLNRLRLDHMNAEERKCISDLCAEYKDIFYSDQLPLTFTNQVKHSIRTKNDDPIYVKPYRQPPAQAEEIKDQVEKLLKNNVIRESYSPWNAPVHLVPKKMDASGEVKFRMVIDYRRLNEITVDDKYPLPNITDLFDRLGKSKYFTTLDLANGYHQIEIEEKDRQKTAFSANGHYEFLRMPFGLKTAPATFQRTMDNVLRGMHGHHCLVYMDDMIIFSPSLQNHINDLRAVFDRLRATNLKVQLDKSEFVRKEVLYLGHTITDQGLKPNDAKIKAVLDYPLPKTTTEIKSFLGLIGYYRRFIKDFAKTTQPLTSCLKKRHKIVIDQNYIDAFERCKELLTNAPLLQYPDPSKPYVLTTDASSVALGAVLSQGTIGNDKPIAYASRTLSDTETRYSTIERELLAIIWAVKHFRPYLYGNTFTIFTDHRPLAWLYSLKEPNSKLTRWRLRLQEYDFKIIYKNGKQNTNADALSRIKLNALGDLDDVSMEVHLDKTERHNIHKETDDQIETLRARSDSEETLSVSDSSETILISDLSETYPRVPSLSNKSETVHSAIELENNGIPILNEAIDTKPNQIIIFTWLRNNLQVRDTSREKQKILEVFMPVNKEELVKQFLKEHIKPKAKYFIYFENKQHRKEFNRVIISLFKEGMVELYECTERVINVEDENEQRAIIVRCHEGKTCHRGIKETMLRIKRNYFWNNMSVLVSSVINGCEACRKMKYDRRPLKPTMQLTQTQDAPFQEIFIDLFTIECHIYLTIVDAFSKLAQAIEINNKSTAEVVRALIKYFSMYGVPNKISSDPGSEFNNELMKELTSMYKIELHICTSHNPNSTGIVERFHSTLIEIYRLAKYDQKCTDASSVMTYAIMAYNNTIHSTTGLSPFEVVFGHTDSNTAFEGDFEKCYMQQLLRDHAKRTKHLYQYISEKMLEKKQKVKEKRLGENVELSEGDIVFVKDINTRKSKDKARYRKATVKGKADRNIVPVEISKRQTKVAIKNIKRPQVVPARNGSTTPQPGPSSTKT